MEKFNKEGYVAICAPRQSGKTTFLRLVIDANPFSSVLVLFPTFMASARFTGNFRNRSNVIVNVMPKDPVSLYKQSFLYNFDIVLGDEVFLKPIPNTKVMCVFSFYPELKFDGVLDDLMYWKGRKGFIPFKWKKIK